MIIGSTGVPQALKLPKESWSPALMKKEARHVWRPVSLKYSHAADTTMKEAVTQEE